MAENHIFRTELQFDASTAQDATKLMQSMQNVLQDLQNSGMPGVEKSTNAVIKQLNSLGTTAQKSGGSLKGLADAFGALTSGVSSGSFNTFQRGIIGMIPQTATLASAISLAAQKEAELARGAKVAAEALANEDRMVAGAEANLARLGRQLANTTKAYADINRVQASRAIGKDLGLNYDTPLRPESIKLYEQLQTQIGLAQQKQKLLGSASTKASSDMSKGILQTIPRIKSLETAVSLASQKAKELAPAVQSGLGNFYPLIVAAGFFGTITRAIKSFGVAVVQTGSEYDTAFAQVARTTTATGSDINGQIAGIRTQLRGLATEIPVSFQGLSQIATLGNQLGIAGDSVVGFTKTVAQFSAVTGVTTEETAKSFGSLAEVLNLTSDQYDNLGSAITYVGRNSVATEGEILTMSQRIGSTAEQAGFTAQQVVGLSGALASLREAPERSQGALEIYFKTLNTAAAQGGAKLKNFANVIGRTTDATKQLIQTNPYQFLREFLGGLSTLDSTSKTSALAALGLSGSRVSEVMRRLAGNLNVVDKAQSDASKSFAAGTDLAGQYSVIAQTLGAKFQVLQNAVANLLDTLSKSGALSGLGILLDLITGAIGAIDTFAQQNRGLVSALLGLSFAVGVLAAIRTGFFLAAIAASALEGASLRAGGANILGNLRNIITVLFGVRTAGFAAAEGQTAAAVGAYTLRSAVLALGRATVILGVLAALTELVLNFGGTMEAIAPIVSFIGQVLGNVTGAFFDFGAGVESTISNVLANVGQLAGVIPFLSGIANGVLAISGAMAKASKVSTGLGDIAHKAGDKFGTDFKDWADKLPKQDDNLPDYSKLSDGLKDVNTELGNTATASIPAASGLGNTGDAAQKTAEKMRTLKDYASDLGDTMSRAFDIRFGPSSSQDDITSAFNDMKKSISDATKALTEAKNKISSIRAEIAKLKADNLKQGYFLSVANAFGDTNRASAIQATIDSNNADISSKQTDLGSAQNDARDAQDKLSRSTRGNTQAALDNRKALQDLVGKYQDYIGKLASSGLSQDDLKKKLGEAKKKFDEQAKALGYNTSQMKPYNKAFDDFLQIVDKIPRNITVNANADPAIQALNEYKAAAKQTAESVSKSLGGLGGKSFSLPKLNNPTLDKEIRRSALEHEIAALAAYIDKVQNGYQKFELSQTLTLDRQKLASGNYWTGGFTGRGNKYEPAGTVHRGEYVVPKNMVDQRSGLPTADALGRLMRGQPGRSGYAGGGFVDPGMGVVELGPRSMSVLRQAVHSEVVAMIAPTSIANATNSVNSSRRRRGGDG